MILESIQFVKKQVKDVVIVDGVETEYGDVVFSVANQPFLVVGEKITGLNWSYTPHRTILEEAIRRMDRNGS